MGAEIAYLNTKEDCKEPTGTIQVKSSRLRATKIKPDEIPGLIDEVPILAVIATQAEGTTLIKGAGELRVKESDRLKALTAELRRMGEQIHKLPDGLEIA